MGLSIDRRSTKGKDSALYESSCIDNSQLKEIKNGYCREYFISCRLA